MFIGSKLKKQQQQKNLAHVAEKLYSSHRRGRFLPAVCLVNPLSKVQTALLTQLIFATGNINYKHTYIRTFGFQPFLYHLVILSTGNVILTLADASVGQWDSARMRIELQTCVLSAYACTLEICTMKWDCSLLPVVCRVIGMYSLKLLFFGSQKYCIEMTHNVGLRRVTFDKCMSVSIVFDCSDWLSKLWFWLFI